MNTESVEIDIEKATTHPVPVVEDPDVEYYRRRSLTVALVVAATAAGLLSGLVCAWGVAVAWMAGWP